jgi:hypothetical protein
MVLAERLPATMRRPSSFPSGSVLVVCLCASLLPAVAYGQAQPPAPPAPAANPPRHEAEQNLVNLPTTQPLSRFNHHFRITHRFARDLRRGDLGDLASDLFGLDNGAVIGLDYRFSPMTNVQIGVYRSMLVRTIQLSGRFDAWNEDDGLPMALSFIASVEGVNNMRDDHAPAVGVVASRTFAGAVATYVSPIFVWNAAAASLFDDGEENTAFIGLGTRVQVRPSVFVVAEYAPRVAGHSPPGRGTWGAAIEKHTRGHLFQINLTNSFGTTYGQTALGGERSNIYLGFNLARKFGD